MSLYTLRQSLRDQRYVLGTDSPDFMFLARRD